MKLSKNMFATVTRSAALMNGIICVLKSPLIYLDYPDYPREKRETAGNNKAWRREQLLSF